MCLHRTALHLHPPFYVQDVTKMGFLMFWNRGEKKVRNGHVYLQYVLSGSNKQEEWDFKKDFLQD